MVEKGRLLLVIFSTVGIIFLSTLLIISSKETIEKGATPVTGASMGVQGWTTKL